MIPFTFSWLCWVINLIFVSFQKILKIFQDLCTFATKFIDRISALFCKLSMAKKTHFGIFFFLLIWLCKLFRSPDVWWPSHIRWPYFSQEWEFNWAVVADDKLNRTFRLKHRSSSPLSKRCRHQWGHADDDDDDIAPKLGKYLQGSLKKIFLKTSFALKTRFHHTHKKQFHAKSGKAKEGGQVKWSLNEVFLSSSHEQRVRDRPRRKLKRFLDQENCIEENVQNGKVELTVTGWHVSVGMHLFIHIQKMPPVFCAN